MRVGIYLGRHGSAASGMAVYASAVLHRSMELLAESQYEANEVVVYGDATILSESCLNEISLHPLLSYRSDRLLDFGATRYFRSLPNGARCRLLVRKLPKFLERRFAAILDQLVLPYFCWRDRIEVLHCLANSGVINSGTPQVITVHDLFQAWPAEQEDSSGLFKGIIRYWYKFLFKTQFRSAKYILTDIKDVANEIKKRFPHTSANIKVVPLGVDTQFVDFAKQLTAEAKSELLSKWLRSHGISEAGFVLCLASSDPRKNLGRALEAWMKLPIETRKEIGLVVKVDNASTEQAARKQLAKLDGGTVHYMRMLSREEMPLLFSSARVLLHPTLAEGFGLPALEALTVGTSVVTGKLESLADSNSTHLFNCVPTNVDSISAALEKAIEHSQVKVSSLTGARELQQATPINRAPYRTMLDVVRENFATYRDVQLRHKLKV